MIFGKSGEQCCISGKYRCFGSCNQWIDIKEGEVFPKYDDAKAFWILMYKAKDALIKVTETNHIHIYETNQSITV